MMQAFVQYRGRAAPLLRANIDTDAIIPSREMTEVSNRGVSAGLFADWRYRAIAGRERDPGFVLNRPDFREATILLTLDNFGCGSSRERPDGVLAEYGIRAILAPSFGAIFRKNCVSNGILAAELDGETVRRIAAWVEENPGAHQPVVDLEHRTVTWGERTSTFGIQDSDALKLLAGLDPIAQTLDRLESIVEFERDYFRRRPWARLDEKKP